MGVQNRRKYDSDFKLNAVLLSLQPGRTVSDVAEKLGINSDIISQSKIHHMYLFVLTRHNSARKITGNHSSIAYSLCDGYVRR